MLAQSPNTKLAECLQNICHSAIKRKIDTIHICTTVANYHKSQLHFPRPAVCISSNLCKKSYSNTPHIGAGQHSHTVKGKLGLLWNACHHTNCKLFIVFLKHPTYRTTIHRWKSWILKLVIRHRSAQWHFSWIHALHHLIDIKQNRKVRMAFNYFENVHYEFV